MAPGQSDITVEKYDYFYSPLLLPLRALPNWAGLYVARGGGKHPNRCLPSHEIIFVRAGVLEIQEEETNFAVRAGEALILGANRRHFGTAEVFAGLEFFWVHFDTKAAEAGLTASGQAGAEFSLSVPKYSAVADPQFVEVLFRHYLQGQEEMRLDPAAASLLITLLLSEIARPPKSAPPPHASTVLAGRAEIYLQTHFHEPLTTSQVAKALLCNPSYLSRVYHQHYGRTVTEALMVRRLEHAESLLLNTNQSVGEIARACGIEDASYFLKLFKRRTGITALTFRRQQTLKIINTK